MESKGPFLDDHGTRQRISNVSTREKLRICVGMKVMNLDTGYKKEQKSLTLEPEGKLKQRKQKQKIGVVKRHQEIDPHMSSV